MTARTGNALERKHSLGPAGRKAGRCERASVEWGLKPRPPDPVHAMEAMW